MSDKIVENMLVITLVGAVICLVFPIIQRIVYKSQLTGAEASATRIIQAVEVLYSKESVESQVDFPFVVEFDNGSYNVYAGGEAYDPHETMKTDINKPISGFVSIESGGNIIISNLKYKHYVCNKMVGEEFLKCEYY